MPIYFDYCWSPQLTYAAAEWWADAFTQLFPSGEAYIFTAVNGYRSMEPEVRVETFERAEASSGLDYGHVILNDSYGVCGFTNHPTIDADDWTITLYQTTGAGYDLWWAWTAIRPRHGGTEQQWRLWRRLMQESWRLR